MKSFGVGKRYHRSLIVCASAALVFGCATTTIDQESVGNAKEKGRGAESQMTGLTSPQVSASAGFTGSEITDIDTLYSSEDSGISVSFINGEQINKIAIKGAESLGTFKTSRLDDPQRLVIDFSSMQDIGSEEFQIEDATLVEGVRIAEHKDSTRMVIDLADISDLNTNVQKEGDYVIATFTQGNPMGDGETQELAKVTESTTTESSRSTEEASIKTASVSLNEITINGQGAESEVVANLSAPASFKVEQTAPSEYVVRIFDTEKSASVMTPVLSTNPETLIRAARLQEEGNDVLLRVFARPEASVQVVPDSDGMLVIKARKMEQEKIMAQADVDEVEGEESAQETPEEGTTDLTEDDFARFLGDTPKYTGRLISLDLQETDIDNALRIIAEVSNLNIIASGDVSGKVTLRLIDVPWDQALDVILKTNGLDKVQEGNVVRIAPVDRLRAEREALKQAQQAEEELEELKVRFIRVSYARAAELKPLVDSVVSERGLVSFDERTNQIIVKDIQRGLKNVALLVKKLDLRTPQVLLETQIVEANRTLLRDLGSEFGFNYVQSPQTGNATGSNFPNSVSLGGAFANPAATTTNAISLLLGSADGSKSLSQAITALENEGTVRVVSRPAVATTNNKAAVIKSIEKVRIRLPQGGVSVATGQGASAAGQGSAATETIDVGIVLNVTPQASPDYYVLLDIDAKSSTLGNQSVDGIPSEIERSAQSSVLISSGQTFALGGIYKIEDATDLDGLPFFKDIPILGNFFRRQNSRSRDEELLFFVTPRIVEGSFDDASMKANV